MKEVVIVYLDNDGLECYRENYKLEELPDWLEVFARKLIKEGKNYGQYGDCIILIR